MKRGLHLTGAIFCVAVVVAFYACGPSGPETIKIGINAPITGDIPKVGECTKFAALMWLEDVNAAGGLEVGGTKYPVDCRSTLIMERQSTLTDVTVVLVGEKLGY